MPTAMPLAPLISRFGKLAGRTRGSLSDLVVVGLEVDRVLVDVVEQQRRGLGQADLGVAHRRRRIAVDRAEIALPVDQRHPHARRSAPCGPWRRRSRRRHAGGICPSRRRPRGRICGAACRPCSRSPAWHTGCGDAPASARRAHPAARGDDHAHGIVEVGAPHLVFERDGRVHRAGCVRCVAQAKGSVAGGSGAAGRRDAGESRARRSTRGMAKMGRDGQGVGGHAGAARAE